MRKNKAALTTMGYIGSCSTCAYILLNNPDHIALYASESVKDLFGLTTDDILADIYCLQWCVSDDEMVAFERKFEEWDGKESYTGEFDFKNLNTGKERRGKAIITDFGEYMLIEVIDISDEIAIRDQLKVELEKARTEERQKSDFLSKMSHEIRTPMNGILGMLTLAKNRINDPDEALECLDKANGLSQFLLSLINDILDMSKIESGKVVLEHEKFDLLEVKNKLYEMFSGTIEQKGIAFDMRLEDMEIRYVLGDSLRLTQVLINFISNASKYTNRGGKIEVVFRQMNRTDEKVHMLFRIKDNGKGMNPKFLSRIFKPFEQEEASTTRKFGGTGLGMAIADNLVSLMGGHIVVDTALGRGSEFSVYIPIDIAPGDQSWEVVKKQEEVVQEHPIAGMRVLMAEDNAINAEIATEILAMDDVITEVADDGAKALERFKASKDWYYDMILMDIQMPNMDGWTAAKEIRKIATDYAQKIPIYALSANAFVEDKRHSVEIGMNGHLSKPIDFENLKKIMREVRAKTSQFTSESNG